MAYVLVRKILAFRVLGKLASVVMVMAEQGQLRGSSKSSGQPVGQSPLPFTSPALTHTADWTRNKSLILAEPITLLLLGIWISDPETEAFEQGWGQG